MYPIFHIRFPHVITVFHHTVKNRHLLSRFFIFTVLVIFIGIIIQRLVGQIVRSLSEHRTVAIEHGDLTVGNGQRRIQKFLDTSIRLIGPSRNRTILLGIETPYCKNI